MARVATKPTGDAAAKQTLADKKAYRLQVEALIRAEVRRIKARSDYNESVGQQLGIASSDGINIYRQRESDSDWMLLARATQSPYVDNRPLLQSGKL